MGPMQLPWLDRPEILRELVLVYGDEYDLGVLSCVSPGLRSVAITESLWKVHLTRRSPALAFASHGNCRQLLVQLELQDPRRDISRYRFCVDMRGNSQGQFLFSAVAILRMSETGNCQSMVLKNLLSTPFSTRRLGDVSIHVLDQGGNLTFLEHLYSTYEIRDESSQCFFLSAPFTIEEEHQHQRVLLVKLRGRRSEGTPGGMEYVISASTGEYSPLEYYYETAIDDMVAEQRSIDAQLDAALADKSVKGVVDALRALRQTAIDKK
eukprot:TRINITY_DN34341_c0_g1_i1.p1 TRINITY_DN34341_c0_g1~~TRINITY_DN34341_c0_g1_i1.p1  ORF type:complete len:266 (-),score=31.60 TRINITY_DN34341_c0_g1_i1:712-1509(-)